MSRPKISILDHRVAGWYYPWMMKGLTPASSPLAEKVHLMKELGYDGTGTSWWDLVSFYQERGDLSQIKHLCENLSFPLTAYGFVAEGWAYGRGAAQRNAILLALRSLDLAHAAGCQGPYLLGPFDSGDLHSAAAAFREICQYGASLGLAVALEFAGVAAQINSVNASLELIEMSGAANAGIAIDSYHFFAGTSTLRDLEAFPASRIQVVHLADGPSDLSDPSLELDRMMPGEGQLPLAEFAQILLGKGFDGYWHVECIQGRDYAASLREVAARALRATRDVLDRAMVHSGATA
jgi:sugar phosphate isomerase/epimerase